MRRATIGMFSGLLVGLFLVVLGGAFALGGWIASADSEPPAGGILTTAEVVGSVERTVLIDGIGRPSFSPVYEYEDVDGRIHRVTDHISTSSRPPTVGSIVEISYLAGEPESVRRTDVDNDWLRWFVVGGGVTAAVGAAVVLVSLVVGVTALARAR